MVITLLKMVIDGPSMEDFFQEKGKWLYKKVTVLRKTFFQWENHLEVRIVCKNQQFTLLQLFHPVNFRQANIFSSTSVKFEIW